jgi:integrase
MWKVGGRRREMGLGSARDVPLARARELAAECRAIVAAGRDPLQARAASRTAERPVPTFGECADAFIAAKQSEWRNEKHRAQWAMTLTKYAAPLRNLPVDAIDTAAVLSALKPIWQAKSETASRFRGRIEQVLDAAKAQGYRAGENPARWRGHLDKLLAKRQKLTRRHHAAMPYADVPAFLRRLKERQAGSVSALALEFAILTAARSGEVLGLRWDEIDKTAKVWTVPPSRMKAAREHRVPLGERALAVLDEAEKARRATSCFPVLVAPAALGHGDGNGSPAHEPRQRDRAWFPVRLPRLGGQRNPFRARGRRSRARTCHRRRGGTGLQARRCPRETAGADGSMGKLLRADRS